MSMLLKYIALFHPEHRRVDIMSDDESSGGEELLVGEVGYESDSSESEDDSDAEGGENLVAYEIPPFTGP